MYRKPIDSSVVIEAGYNPEKEILEIKYANQNIYQYVGLSFSTYEDFMKSDSKGQFMMKSIKPKHTCVRVQ